MHLTNLTSLQGAIGSLSVDARARRRRRARPARDPACIGALPADVRGALTATPRVLLFPGRIDLLPPAGARVEVRLRPLARRGGLAFAVIGVERAGVAVDGQRGAAHRCCCARTLGSLPFGVARRVGRERRRGARRPAARDRRVVLGARLSAPR